MKAEIKKGCNGCGLCTDLCPGVFQMNRLVYANVYVKEIAPKDSKKALKAQTNCPVNVITVTE
ncbi:MAG: hypothetical protein ACFWTJ_12035 [Lachnoclostridium sp.]